MRLHARRRSELHRVPRPQDGDPLTRHSGYSLAYDYALSALVKADRDTAVTVNDKLSEEVKADRRARSEYLRQFEGPGLKCRTPPTTPT
ncbi:MAG: DUF3810 family protein [Coriobacteriaceae bacterium]